jgi:hypothetical protein
MDFNRIKSNISKMIDMGAPESDIDAYVAEEGVTPEMLRGEQGAQVQREGKRTLGPEIPFLPSMVMRAGEGVTFGFLDEIAGAISGDVEASRSVLDRARESTGLAGDAAEIAGAVGSSIALPVGRVAQGASLGAKALGATKAGAAGGALYGAGEADGGVLDRARGAAVGGAAGAVTGAVAAPLVAGAGLGLRKAARSVGFGAGRPENVAARKVAQSLDRDQTTPAQVSGELAAARQVSPDAQIADIAGENTTKLLDAAAMVPGQARKELVEGLHNRQSKQYMRLQDAIADTVGDGSKFYETADNLIASRAARAKPLYERAYATPTPYTTELESVLQRPLMQQLVRRARADALNTGDDFKQFFIEVGEDGIQINKVPDTRALDRIKRTIDSMLGAVKRGEQTGLKAADKVSLTKLKSDLMDAIENPQYKKALKTYAGDSALTNALDDGYLAFNKMQPEEITRAIKGLGKDEADLFRMGVARAIYEKLAQGNVGRNRAEILKQPVIASKLKAIFPDAVARGKFMRALDLEDRMFRTRAKVTGGSPTASRQTELQDAGFDPADIADTAAAVGAAARGDLLGLAMRAMMRGKNRMTGMTPEVSDEIIRLLTSNDVSAIERQMAADAVKRLAAESGNTRIQQLVTRALAPLAGGGASQASQPLFAGTVRPTN